MDTLVLIAPEGIVARVQDLVDGHLRCELDDRAVVGRLYDLMFDANLVMVQWDEDAANDNGG